jgi:FkbM family methyltransferase
MVAEAVYPLRLAVRVAPLGATLGGRVRLWLAVASRRLPAPGSRRRRRRRFLLRLEGASHELVLTDPSEFQLLASFFLDREYEQPLSRPPKVIVDAGSNIGLSVLFFRSHYPDSRVYAIEPDPETFDRLTLNLERLSGVEAAQLALSDQVGRARFFRSTSESWTSSLFPVGRVLEEVTVDTVTLDEFLSAHRLSEVDLLKLDIEGAEYRVLRSSRRLASIRHIVAELHFALGGYSERMLREVLADFDLHLSRRTPDGALLSARRRSARPPADLREEPS